MPRDRPHSSSIRFVIDGETSSTVIGPVPLMSLNSEVSEHEKQKPKHREMESSYRVHGKAGP